MTENKEQASIIRNVRSLLSEHFYIPKYQRGYRWTNKQVEDLAYQTIKSWFENKEKSNEFDTNKFESKLLSDSKFIWYDINQNGQNNDKEEDVFIRLNDGKIPLTNSELIKALFLNSSNFVKDENEEEIRLRQLEISTQWDIIEQELSDNEFWYFISGKENTARPRIEYLFDVIAQNTKNKEDRDSTFRYFQSKFEENEQNNVVSFCIESV